MTQKMFPAALLATALAVAAPASAATIVFSDNFDDGDVSDWSVTSSANITVPVVAVDSAFSVSPDYSMIAYFMAPTGGSGEGTVRATQSFTAPVAGNYLLELDARSSGCLGCIMSYDVLVNGTLLVRASEPSATFDDLSFNLLALGAGVHTITLGMHTDAAQSGQFRAQFDNVVISTNAEIPVGTPEPATMALFGAGLLGLAGLRRRS